MPRKRRGGGRPRGSKAAQGSNQPDPSSASPAESHNILAAGTSSPSHKPAKKPPGKKPRIQPVGAGKGPLAVQKLQERALRARDSPGESETILDQADDSGEQLGDSTVPSEAEGEEAMSRNKARNGSSKEENEEELAMYAQIKVTLKKLSGIQRRQQQLSNEIQEIEKAVVEAENNNREDEARPARDKLEALYRENVKLTSDEKAILDQEPHDLIKNVEILAALRSHTESNQQRGPPPLKARKLKGAKPEADLAAESPGPTSTTPSSATTRIKGAVGRSGSVPFAREGKEATAVKLEDGGAGGAAERAGKLVAGAEVAYKQAKPKEDGSQWIQCTILAVTESSKGGKVYKVQDTEPDEPGAPGAPGDVYKATAAALIAIPPRGSALSDFPVGKHVLARYPDTSTFYNAEVTGMKKDICKLKFEDDMNQEMDVDRRYVLELTSK